MAGIWWLAYVPDAVAAELGIRAELASISGRAGLVGMAIVRDGLNLQRRTKLSTDFAKQIKLIWAHSLKSG